MNKNSTIHVASKRKKVHTLEKEFPDFKIIDVTSKATSPWVKFSPFYPHDDIPVPFSNEMAASVEGVWQGLKVFESTDIDITRFSITTMKGIKRTVRRYGKVQGHRKGTNGSLISYIEARKQIYLPCYNWVLENKLRSEVLQLKEIAHDSGLVLLDYETNCDIDNPQKPFSHASLIKQHIENFNS